MRVPFRFILLCVLPLAACGTTARDLAERLNPYRIDIRQGNYVDQEMIAKLKKGMSREQVSFVLGTPLLADMFHHDRWDYVYSFRKAGGEPEQRRLTVVFADDRLDHVEGDVVAAAPGGDAAAATADASAPRVIDLAPPAAAKP